MAECSELFNCTGDFNQFAKRSATLNRLLNTSIYTVPLSDRAKHPLFVIGIVGLIFNAILFILLLHLLRHRKLPWKKYWSVANLTFCDGATSLFVACAIMRGVGSVLQRNFIEVSHYGRAKFLPSWSVFFQLAFWCPMIGYCLVCSFQFIAVYFPLIYSRYLTRPIVGSVIGGMYVALLCLSLISVFGFNAKPEYCVLPEFFTDFSGKLCVLLYQHNYGFALFQTILLIIFVLFVLVIYSVTLTTLLRQHKKTTGANAVLRSTAAKKTSGEVTTKFLEAIGPALAAYAISVIFMLCQWIYLIARSHDLDKRLGGEFPVELTGNCSSNLKYQLQEMSSENRSLTWIRNFSWIAYLRLIIEPILHFAMTPTLRNTVFKRAAIDSVTDPSEIGMRSMPSREASTPT